MSIPARAIRFLILSVISCANTTWAGDTDVVQMPRFTKIVTVSGEQAEALMLAIGELKKENLELKRYVIRVEQAKEVFAVIFDSATRRMSETGSPSDGPPVFEVTVSRPTMTVLKA